jgi:signal transduction histidine kinase
MPAEGYRQLWETILAGKEWRGEFHNKKKNGELYWEEATISAIRDGAGTITHFVAVKEDITERKRAEKELKELQERLLDTARQAGMAEVATSVLHNVGNVLNSVVTSSALVLDKLRQSKLSSLAKAAALLESHANDLPAYFAEDPRAKLLPRFLSELAGRLATEQAQISAELDSLTANVDHIRQIIAMQQSYARVAGAVELLSVNELMDDAVRINAAGFERRQVRVVREYGKLPQVMLEKHKVLQILVNLLGNAKYALEEASATEKRLVLRTESDANSRLRITVIDNGIGIRQENLKRIFELGFTTRKEGHGFGLHNGALAAREMGGSLNVHSEGPGKGATFVLELPLQPVLRDAQSALEGSRLR